MVLSLKHHHHLTDQVYYVPFMCSQVQTEQTWAELSDQLHCRKGRAVGHPFMALKSISQFHMHGERWRFGVLMWLNSFQFWMVVKFSQGMMSIELGQSGVTMEEAAVTT